MATQPQMQPQSNATPAVQVSAKLLTGIVSLITLQVQMGQKYESLATQTQADMKAFGLDKKGARAMLSAAFEKAHTEQARKDKVPADQLLSHVKACLERNQPDISKILTLACPKDEAASIELQKAKDAGLGINKQLEVARGNTTVAAIQAERENVKAGAAKETARPQSGATAQPQPPAPETAAMAKLTPKERIGNQFAAFLKWGESLGLSRPEVLETLSDLIAEASAESAAAESK